MSGGDPLDNPLELAFRMLLGATLLVAFWYFSTVHPTGGWHGVVFAAGLIAVWGVFYYWHVLQRIPVVRRLLVWSGRLAVGSVAALLYGYVYYKIFVG